MSTQLPPVPSGKGPAPLAPPQPKIPVATPPPAPAAAAPAIAGIGGVDGDLALELGFWQHPFVQNVLPFLTSLILHLALLTIAMLTYKVVKDIVQAPKEQVIIPDSDLVDNGLDTIVPHPGLGGDASRDAAQDKVPDVPKNSLGMAEIKGPNRIPEPPGGGSGDSEGGALIGSGLSAGGSGNGMGSGKGSGLGSGTGDGSGDLAPFGIPGGGGGLGTKFIGVRVAARRIAYVCDASGSMTGMFDWLRSEIYKSVDQLKPIQSFNVIFFSSGDTVLAADKSTLMAANSESKKRTHEFVELGVAARGTTNPLPALELAFRQGPELIFLLTDGDFPDNDAVIKFFREHNKDGRVKVNTLAFMSKVSKERGDSQGFVKVLDQIAKENGGKCKMVSDEDEN